MDHIFGIYKIPRSAPRGGADNNRSSAGRIIPVACSCTCFTLNPVVYMYKYLEQFLGQINCIYGQVVEVCSFAVRITILLHILTNVNSNFVFHKRGRRNIGPDYGFNGGGTRATISWPIQSCECAEAPTVFTIQST